MKFVADIFNKRANWAIPYAIFLAMFVALPLVLILVYAFQNGDGAFSLENFKRFIEQPEAINTLIYSIGIALITTILCILLGYPAAWILSNRKLNRSEVTVVLFILPMWVNILVRTLATVALFDFVKLPLGEGALIFGMVYNFLPFMIYPIYNTLQKMDHSLIEAAEDLGATPMEVFRKVTVPLSMPGVMSGIMMVFMPTISTFAISRVATAVTTRDRLGGGLLYGDGKFPSVRKGAHVDLLVGKERVKLTLRAVHAGKTSTAIEGVDVERCRGAALKLHIHDLMVKHVVVTMEHTLAVLGLAKRIDHVLVGEVCLGGMDVAENAFPDT